MFAACLAILLIFLSISDMIFTLWLTHSGMAVEANPIMKFFLDIDQALFVFVKIITTFGLVFILYHYRNHPDSNINMNAVLAVCTVFFIFLVGQQIYVLVS